MIPSLPVPVGILISPHTNQANNNTG